jgi:hypothetical protein
MLIAAPTIADTDNQDDIENCCYLAKIANNLDDIANCCGASNIDNSDEPSEEGCPADSVGGGGLTTATVMEHMEKYPTETDHDQRYADALMEHMPEDTGCAPEDNSKVIDCLGCAAALAGCSMGGGVACEPSDIPACHYCKCGKYPCPGY